MPIRQGEAQEGEEMSQKNFDDSELQDRWRAAARQRLVEFYSIPGMRETISSLRKMLGEAEISEIDIQALKNQQRD